VQFSWLSLNFIADVRKATIKLSQAERDTFRVIVVLLHVCDRVDLRVPSQTLRHIAAISWVWWWHSIADIACGGIYQCWRSHVTRHDAL